MGTHIAVAATIAAGAADVGLGIRAVDLDFIPVALEQYDVVSTIESDGKIYQVADQYFTVRSVQERGRRFGRI